MKQLRGAGVVHRLQVCPETWGMAPESPGSPCTSWLVLGSRGNLSGPHSPQHFQGTSSNCRVTGKFIRFLLTGSQDWMRSRRGTGSRCLCKRSGNGRDRRRGAVLCQQAHLHSVAEGGFLNLESAFERTEEMCQDL